MLTHASEARLKTEQLVGTGLTSEVFSWGDDHVLKLFLPWVASATIEREFGVTQAICASGVPTPAAIEILQVGERRGIVFERIRGMSLLKRVEGRPWMLFAGARQLAELHARIHACAAPDQLPTQRGQLERWIDEADDFTHEQKERARRHVSKLPAAACLCHGDFHPDNILLTESGPKIIDWSAATRGHPLADVARTSVLFESANLPPTSPVHIRFLMKIARRMLHSAYLKRYLQLSPAALEEIEFWRVPQRMAGSAWRAGRRKAMETLVNSRPSAL